MGNELVEKVIGTIPSLVLLGSWMYLAVRIPKWLEERKERQRISGLIAEGRWGEARRAAEAAISDYGGLEFMPHSWKNLLSGVEGLY